MAFDSLLNLPMNEPDLNHKVCQELQRKFSTFKNMFFFLRLVRCENGKSQIVDVKVFSDKPALEAYFFDTQLQRACIYIVYRSEGYFYVGTGGFKMNEDHHVFSDKIVQNLSYEARYDIEAEPMITREEIAEMFGQLTVAVSKARKKAM